MYKAALVINPTKEVRSLARDMARDLSGYARNFYFTELEQLYMNVQFLGTNVSQESISEIQNLLNNTIPHIKSPEITISGARFGRRGKLRPSTIFFKINATDELRELSRAIHNSIKELNLTDVKRDKDFGKHLFNIRVANTKRGMSRSISNEISTFLTKRGYKDKNISFNPPSISIQTRQFNGTQTKYSTISTIEFMI